MVKNGLKLNLKWKLTLYVIGTILLIIFAISFSIYFDTKKMVMSEINDKIAIIKEYQKGIIKDLIAETNKKITEFAANEDIYLFTNILDRDLSNEGNNQTEMLDSYYVNSIIDRSKLLAVQVSSEEYYQFAYLTNSSGLVIADSRLNKSNMNTYFGKKLAEEEYKSALTERVYLLDDRQVMLFQVPIKKKGQEEVIGYYVMGVSLDIFKSKLSQYKVMIDGDIQLINLDGVVLNHEDNQLIGKKTIDPIYLELINDNKDNYSRVTDKYYKILERLDNEIEIYLAIDIPTRVINGPILLIARRIVVLSLVGLLVSVIVIWLLAAWQLRPLETFSTIFGQLEKGNLREEMLLDKSITRCSDEIGVLGKAFNSMVIKLRNIITNINSASDRVAASSTKLKEVSAEVSSVSNQITESIQTLAEGAEEQAGGVDNINSKIKNLAQGIDKLRKNNQNVEKLANEMRVAVEKGSGEISKVKDQMNNIKYSIEEVAEGIENLGLISNQIDDILEIINSIAEQTNMLALNAAIEAARAGETGRGFSVVAEEIRNLAEETVVSSEKISNLIKEIKEETNNASFKMKEGTREIESGSQVVMSAESAFGEIQLKIDEVVEGITQAVTVIKGVNQDSNEIVDNVDNISQIIESYAANTEEVAASSEEQVSSIEQLTSLADTLSDMAEELYKLVKTFKLN